MELQKTFTPQYVNSLVNNINVDNYKQDFFPIDENQVRRLSGIEHPEGLEDKMLKAHNLFDAAILLYEAYEGISPVLASNTAFWTYLTHVDLFKYVKSKWPDIKSVTYIKDHWFYSKGSMRTSLMGLWWSVYLTIDKEKPEGEKYNLTKVFFSNDGLRTRRLGTGHLGRNREALKGILQFMLDNKEIFENGMENRMIFITRHFNMLGGSQPLSYKKAKFFYDELNKEKIKNHLISINKREDVTGPNAFI